MPFFVIERQIPHIEYGELLRDTELYELVGGMVEGIPTHPIDLLAETSPGAIKPFPAPRPRFCATPFFLELGQRFRPPLLDGSETPTGNGQGLLAVRDHPQVNASNIESASLVGRQGHG